MVYEIKTIIKRKIWQAKCDDCGLNDIRLDNAPRERMCPCGKWIEFKEESYTGPELRDNK